MKQNPSIKKILLTGLVILTAAAVLSGCGLQALTSAIVTPTPAAPTAGEPSAPVVESPAAAEPQTEPAAPAEPLPDGAAARQTVQDFLTAVQLDPNSTIATQLLTPALVQASTQEGGLQAALLKTSEAYPSFEVSAPQLTRNGQEANVEATLFFQKPANMNFVLVIEDGMWKINEIKPIAAGGDYPATPEGVVQAFLIAYQERPDRMSDFLSASRRANQPPGGAVGMLQVLGSLEGVLVQSAVVNPDPPQAAIVVLIKAGGIDAQRQFILVQENNRWGIDQISPVQ